MSASVWMSQCVPHVLNRVLWNYQHQLRFNGHRIKKRTKNEDEIQEKRIKLPDQVVAFASEFALMCGRHVAMDTISLMMRVAVLHRGLGAA